MTAFTQPMPSGVLFDLEDPRPEMVRLSDIVHHLVRLNRWNGNIEPVSYTIAQHSLATAQACTLIEARPYCLLHNAPAAYTGELRTAVKLWAVDKGADFTALEKRILYTAILPAFGLAPPTDAIALAVDKAAQIAAATELRDMVAGKPPAWHPNAQPLKTRLKFTPAIKIEEQFRLALEGALRPFGKVA
ncbi:5'-deoxynucleotidase YfbR [Devosia crocina]|uniref:5'-deoxynucleotidase YfbR n=1 Tax=Devosia crocina TaxID=429728 RepID=A0A1I7NF32_9HYPH|nr:hypothetical protein [Devosia crocina]SFV33271.1 5'-deoxynucleotidase YfbR [Devosia crocina]